MGKWLDGRWHQYLYDFPVYHPCIKKCWGFMAYLPIGGYRLYVVIEWADCRLQLREYNQSMLNKAAQTSDFTKSIGRIVSSELKGVA